MMPGSVRLGVVLLCHADLDIAARMARIWAEGGAQVCIHIDANVRDRHVELMRVALADLKRVAFSARRHRCKWGPSAWFARRRTRRRNCWPIIPT